MTATHDARRMPDALPTAMPDASDEACRTTTIDALRSAMHATQRNATDEREHRKSVVSPNASPAKKATLRIPISTDDPTDWFEESVRAPIRRTGERPPISPMLRRLVYRRDRWTCQSCGAYSQAKEENRRSGALHLDHIVPWSAGGIDRSDNLRTLCGPCNIKRSNFVSSSDKPAMPIVKICTPCLVAVEPRFERFLGMPGRFTVYCAKVHHEGWAVRGWHIV